MASMAASLAVVFWGDWKRWTCCGASECHHLRMMERETAVGLLTSVEEWGTSGSGPLKISAD